MPVFDTTMCLWPGKESGWRVRNQYEKRIKDFVRQQHGPRGSRPGDDALQSLLIWVDNVIQERRTLQTTLSERDTAITVKDTEIRGLTTALSGSRSDTANAEAGIRDLQAQGKLMQEKHVEDLTRLSSQHQDNMKDTVTKYNNQISTLHSNHNDANKRSEQKHRTSVAQLVKQHEAEIAKYKYENKELVGQLLVNQDKDRAWPDNKVKMGFQDIQRQIEAITSPNVNKQFLLLKNVEPGSDLDPTHFIARAGRYKFHFLLRSNIWEILRQQFFSAPFGFGAFGTGSAPQRVWMTYFPWKDLFNLSAGSGKNNTLTLSRHDRLILLSEDFSIFKGDKLANNLRSATFSYFNSALLAGEGHGTSTESPLWTMSQKNVAETVERIIDCLSKAAALSNNFLRSELEEDIQTMVQTTFVLALQFGVQPAQLEVFSPQPGELVKIGEEFHDCEDGDLKKGAQYFVDLVASPGLLKVGDGRSAKIARRSVVPCEIYPQEADS
jgi:hypothetical protein